jgi:hypothetical protein
MPKSKRDAVVLGAGPVAEMDASISVRKTAPIEDAADEPPDDLPRDAVRFIEK